MKKMFVGLVFCIALLMPQRTNTYDMADVALVGSVIGLAGGVWYLCSSNSKIYCCGCNRQIAEGEMCIKMGCHHLFHRNCMPINPHAACIGCEQARAQGATLMAVLEAGFSAAHLVAEINRPQNQEKRSEEQRKQEQRWQAQQDEALAKRLAAQESSRVRGGYATSAQARADQCDAHGQAYAEKCAQDELRKSEQAAARARAYQAQEAAERHSSEAFHQSQQRIRATPWMMESCSICLAPRAQRGDILVDLKDLQYKTHTVALPCGHVYHTECIKEWAKAHNMCPLCNNTFNPRDL